MSETKLTELQASFLVRQLSHVGQSMAVTAIVALKNVFHFFSAVKYVCTSGKVKV